MNGIEEAFSQTTAILLGSKLSQIGNYESWLWKGIKGRVEEKKSKISAKPVYVASLDFFTKMGGNIATLPESLALAEKKIPKAGIENLTFEGACSKARAISLTTPEIVYGKNIGTEQCACYGPTQDCYRSTFTWYSKAIAYSFWCRTSEFCFGCSNAVDCKYCMRCFSCAKLTRCFEMSDCNLCSDSMFCHNCENVENSMFCFNAKGLRYAIGNTEVGKEKYLEIKKRILSQIAQKLEKSKKLEMSIFNIGCYKK